MSAANVNAVSIPKRITRVKVNPTARTSSPTISPTLAASEHEVRTQPGFTRPPSVSDLSGPLLVVGASPEQNDQVITDLTLQVKDLWTKQTGQASTVKRTRAELNEIRCQLGAKLFAAKQHLARPGCKGDWNGFVRTTGLVLRTADRYAEKHSLSLALSNNLDTVQVPLSPEAVSKLVAEMQKKLSKKLVNSETVEQFLAEIAPALQAALPRPKPILALETGAT